MSLILNARRHQSKGESQDGSRDTRTTAVDHPPRDPRRPLRYGLPAQQIIGITAGAVALGFLSVALPVYWAARQTPASLSARPPVRPMVQKNGATAYVHNNLGVAYLLAGQLDHAAAQLRVALAVDSASIESLVNLALVEKAAGRTAEAGDLLRRAVSQDPRHAGSHYNLAAVADEGGDLVSAAAHYRAFLQYGAISYPDLAGPVRSRLATLESG